MYTRVEVKTLVRDAISYNVFLSVFNGWGKIHLLPITYSDIILSLSISITYPGEW